MQRIVIRNEEGEEVHSVGIHTPWVASSVVACWQQFVKPGYVIDVSEAQAALEAERTLRAQAAAKGKGRRKRRTKQTAKLLD